MSPVLGGILAATLYDYLFCPNPALKNRLATGPFTSTKYQEIQARRSADLLGKQPLFTILDVERAERKEREQEIEVSGEVLSSV